jgi:hypothetical protein
MVKDQLHANANCQDGLVPADGVSEGLIKSSAFEGAHALLGRADTWENNSVSRRDLLWIGSNMGFYADMGAGALNRRDIAGVIVKDRNRRGSG